MPLDLHLFFITAAILSSTSAAIAAEGLLIRMSTSLLHRIARLRAKLVSSGAIDARPPSSLTDAELEQLMADFRARPRFKCFPISFKERQVKLVAQALVVMPFALASLNADAFKMGSEAQYTIVKSKGLDLLNNWTYERISSDSIRFGDPVHEDMTVASIKLAQSTSAKVCSVDGAALQAFISRPKTVSVRSSMCCSPSARSFWCRQLGDKRYSSFDQSAPIVDGSRWNDDPCHMTLWKDRPSSRVAWAAWMVDSKYMESNNVNYASHYHEKQFLHAMASGSRGKSADYLEPRSSTRRKILAWAEFAFRVADGSLPPKLTLRAAAGQLEASSRRAFELGFGSSDSLTIGFLFTGKVNSDPLQVRQIALGALLHTIQDSFSSSHVLRERDPKDSSGSPLLRDKGRVVRFLTYRGQSAAAHGEADRRPADWNTLQPGDLHPVAIGADLISCAAAASFAESTWSQAKVILEGAFALVNDNRDPSASPGAYAVNSNVR